jgi:hypothetical protein
MTEKAEEIEIGRYKKRISSKDIFDKLDETASTSVCRIQNNAPVHIYRRSVGTGLVLPKNEFSTSTNSSCFNLDLRTGERQMSEKGTADFQCMSVVCKRSKPMFFFDSEGLQMSGTNKFW